MMTGGMEFLESALMASAVPVTYGRGTATYAVVAVRAGVSWNAIQRMGDAALESSARDFILRRADLSNLDITPRPKDTITDGSEVWTVFNQLDNECWRAVGDTGLIRVHCRK